MSTAELSSIVSRLEDVTTRLEGVAGSAGGVKEEAVAAFVQLYDAILQGPLVNYLNLSSKIGGDVKTQADLVHTAFKAQRQFLITASKSQPPAQNMLMQLLKPTSDQIQAIQDFRQKNRTSVFFNHLSAISESIPALGWVAVSPTPAPYVKEMLDAGQFYTNRVLVDYKEKDKQHVDWAKSWIQTLSELQLYVKQHHTTGLTWNPKGSVASGSAGFAPPPPPGPPPPPMDFDVGCMGDPVADSRAALFQALNKGEDITKGLKKVTSDQQTHKNPCLRTQGSAPYKASTASAQNVSQPAMKTPKVELQGKKWIVEHHNNNKNLVLTDVHMNQVVYIFNCINSTIQVKGKVNSITLDACKKSAVVFENIVASVEFINCQSVQAQALGKVPTVSIDKTDGVQIYLNPDTLDVEIVSSKSSEMNVLIPKSDGDYTELPIPEQFKTKWTGHGLKTEVVEQA